MDKNVKEYWEAINQGLVPNGYKKTKVGIIPEGWEVKKLGEISEINKENLSNLSSELGLKKFYYYDLSSVNVGEIYKPKNKIKYDQLPSRAKRLFEKDNILFSTVRPNLKGFAYIDFDVIDSICSTGFAVLDIKKGFVSKYIYFNLFSKNIENRINSLTVGSNYPALNLKEVKGLKIPIPPMKEQERIADILSTWDKSIESYGKLLEEKKERKKGLMQMLLTGEKRLGGFTGPWKEVRLGEIFSIPNKKEVINPEINEIITVRLHRKGVFTGLQNETLSLGSTKYYYRRSGQFIYGKQNIFNGAFGLIPKKLDMCYSSADIPSLDFKDGLVVPEYVDYYFSRRSIYKRLESRAIGTGSKRLHESEFLKIEITLPSLEEQKAIAEVLATADREIELLEKLIEELEEEKKGLMQLLLKGIVRV